MRLLLLQVHYASLKQQYDRGRTVPPTVTIAAGQTTASFPSPRILFTSDLPISITAIFGTSTLANTLVPKPLLWNVTSHQLQS